MAAKNEIYLPDRQQWRAWLEEHHSATAEVWLVYYKKHTSKPRVPYDDAVEEALCFGWIDGTVKRLDDERYMQRFTPRRDGSSWSEANKARVRRLIQQKKMTAVGLAKVEAAKASGEWARPARAKRDLPTPSDLEEAFAAHEEARRNWLAFAPSYRRMYVEWVEDAKRPATRARRIDRVVEYAEHNKKTMM